MDKHYAKLLFSSASSLGHYKKQNFWVLYDLRGQDQGSIYFTTTTQRATKVIDSGLRVRADMRCEPVVYPAGMLHKAATAGCATE